MPHPRTAQQKGVLLGTRSKLQNKKQKIIKSKGFKWQDQCERNKRGRGETTLQQWWFTGQGNRPIKDNISQKEKITRGSERGINLTSFPEWHDPPPPIKGHVILHHSASPPCDITAQRLNQPMGARLSINMSAPPSFARGGRSSGVKQGNAAAAS